MTESRPSLSPSTVRAEAQQVRLDGTLWNARDPRRVRGDVVQMPKSQALLPAHRSPMIGGHDERPRRGHTLESDHLDTTVEEADEESREYPEEPIGGGLSQDRGGRYRPRSRDAGRRHALPPGRPPRKRPGAHGKV